VTGRRNVARGRRAGPRLAAAIAVAAVISACGAGAGGSPAPPSDEHPATTPPGSGPSSAGAAAAATPPPAAPALPLAGKAVGIDPGHNGGNFNAATFIGHLIWNGREMEACDTTGTTTDGGYTETQFNFNVASYLRADLRRDGARVVMTRTTDDGVGPCVDRRAEILNDAHVNVAIDIHADGGPPGGRGFTILEPVSDGPNDAVIGSSQRFGDDLRQAFLTGVPAMPESTYVGDQGIMPRDDLAGLNLTRVPKVLVECGNMRNATDAGLLVSAGFQQRVARAIEAAIKRFLNAG